MKTVIIHNIITHYKTPVFNALNQELNKKKHKLHVLYLAPIEKRRDWHIDLDALKHPYTLLTKQPINNIPQFKWIIPIWETLTQLKPDTVIICEYSHLAYWTGFLWAKWHRKAIYLWNESTYQDRKRPPWKEWIKKQLVKRCTGGFSTGTQSRAYLKSLGLKENKIHIIGYVVDNDYYIHEFKKHQPHRSDYLKAANMPLHNFIFIGRFAEEKNILRLLHAYRLVRLKGLDWGLILLGDGPLKPEIQAEIKRLNLPYCFMPGFIQRTELCQYLAMADILILPSISEPWGLVVNEAMACGLPVMASKTCGCYPDIVQENKNGLTFDAKNTTDLAKGMLKLAQYPDQKQLKQNSQKIIADYTPKNTAKKIVTALKEAPATIKQKKVLILNTAFHGGGAAAVARSLFYELNKTPELEMHYAYSLGRPAAHKNTYRISYKYHAYSHALATQLFGYEGFGCKRSTKKLIRYIQKNQFDLIHIHNLHGYYIDYATLIAALAKLKIPVIWTLHDEWALTWLPGYHMGCRHCQTGMGPCTNPYPNPNPRCKWALNPQLKRKQRLLSQLKATIVCPSHALTQQLKSSFLKNKTIETILNGVDTAWFKPQNKITLRKKHAIPADKNIILYSALKTNNPIKGSQFIPYLAKKLPQNYQIITIGKGGIKGPNIKNIGYIENTETLSEFYALADIVCFPSLAEICPLVVLESLSCGTPVAGFNIPALKEILDPIAFPQAPETNAESLKALITQEIDTLNANPKLSDRFHTYILERYALSTMVKNYQTLYKNTM